MPVRGKVLLRYALMLFAMVAGLCLFAVGAPLASEDRPVEVAAPSGGSSLETPEEATSECRKMASLMEQHKTQLLRETGQLKREIAALREELARPGIKEVFAGIGYIFGLAGVGLYVHSRRTGCTGGQ